jgi:prohibitin 1
MKAEQERQAQVIKSQGDAEAAALVAEAVSTHGKGLVMMRRIEAAEQISETLAHSRNITYLPGGKGGQNLLLNVKTR